ncbi:hypothetical protein [Saccharomonospora xinjiangensis]|uniref:Uncharacterized protein n=1 Tax=Saccharomonospora xinjiangensis XJ-54 TaxID=882086 RepID=I0UZ04_9PSEU|nr:hypothetical protein SacxiDRAFT_0842 [Saccharomonospora xinjiangensis XJ-54]
MGDTVAVVTDTSTLTAAATFLTANARLLDQHRYRLLTGNSDPEATLSALAAYRNPDGGYGHGLEPDLRSPESQPAAALHALEVLAELGPVTSSQAGQLCDWLLTASLPDGGLPFALPITTPESCAPFWVQADPTTSSLQITAVVTLHAHRVAVHDRAVADHPWLARATEFCVSAIRALREEDRTPHAIELAFAVRFADVLSARHPEIARDLFDVLGAFVPADGTVHVQGGAEDEYMRPLDFAPAPGSAQQLLSPEAIEADLERLRSGQADDGGWTVDFVSYSPAAALEWRGYATVGALRTLIAYDG